MAAARFEVGRRYALEAAFRLVLGFFAGHGLSFGSIRGVPGSARCEPQCRLCPAHRLDEPRHQEFQ
jgi:hypothetical protein